MGEPCSSQGRPTETCSHGSQKNSRWTEGRRVSEHGFTRCPSRLTGKPPGGQPAALWLGKLGRRLGRGCRGNPAPSSGKVQGPGVTREGFLEEVELMQPWKVQGAGMVRDSPGAEQQGQTGRACRCLEGALEGVAARGLHSGGRPSPFAGKIGLGTWRGRDFCSQATEDGGQQELEHRRPSGLPSGGQEGPSHSSPLHRH